MTDLHTEGGKLMAGTHEVLKGWESYSGWYWFGVEEDANEPGLWFGLVQGFEEEWGDFYVPEILSLGPTVAWPIKACDLAIAGRRTR